MITGPRNRPIIAHVTETVREALRETAKVRGLSVSQLIYLLLRDHFKLGPHELLYDGTLESALRLSLELPYGYEMVRWSAGDQLLHLRCPGNAVRIMEPGETLTIEEAA